MSEERPICPAVVPDGDERASPALIRAYVVALIVVSVVMFGGLSVVMFAAEALGAW